jgi:hypothetical protein
LDNISWFSSFFCQHFFCFSFFFACLLVGEEAGGRRKSLTPDRSSFGYICIALGRHWSINDKAQNRTQRSASWMRF